MNQPARSRPDLWLWIILAVGVGLRLLYFTAPYADAHRWRQVENLAVAWGFVDGGMNPWYPRAIWGGIREPFVEMEAPLVPFILAVSWKLFGFHELFGRVIGIAASVLLLWSTYRVGERLFARATGRAAALFLAVCPTAVFFGRVPMTDTPMIAASTLAVLGYAWYVDSGSRTWALIAGASAMTAWLLKIPSLLILAPIAIIGWQARGWRLLRDVWFVGGLAIAFLVTAIWYIHALELFRWTGWTVGIWHQAGEHPPDIAALSGNASSWSLWSSWALLSDWDFYHALIDRAWQFHLTALGLAGLLFGLVRVWREPRGLVVVAWFTAAIAFVLVVGVGNYWHEYYQLPVLPPTALLFGIGAAPLFNGSADARLTWRDRLERAGRGIVAVGLALASFYYSGAIPHYFRPDSPDMLPIQAGKAIGNHVPPGDGIIVVEYEEGTNSPILLYHAKRHGWSFDLATLSPKVIEHLKAQGATYVATTIYSAMAEKRPDVIEYLRGMREVPLGSRMSPEARLYELH